MRFLAVVHKYPPIHNAGAEWMLHAILVDLIARGHEANVVFPGAGTYYLDGVAVGPTPKRNLEALCREADVVITHLDNTGAAVRAARIAERPIVHLVHNDRQIQFHNIKPAEDTLLVANSEWIARGLPAAYATVICRPPVDLARYTVTRGESADALTLINTTGAKGSGLFYRLARELPDRRFLGVRGAYGVQERPRRHPANLQIVGQTPRIAEDVYARTRILLMPSAYESWGRVAIEAAASGIPTIAHPTPGLRESLGVAGTFADRHDLGAWVDAIHAIDADYAAHAGRARARAAELQAITDADLERLERRIVALHAATVGAPYHGAMPITTGLRVAALCPVCGADNCRCSDGSGTTIVHDDGITAGVTSTYSTWRGQFRYTHAGAVRAGLTAAKDDPRLPTAVVRRLKGTNRDLVDRTTAAYAAATHAERDRFLENVAHLNPRALANELPELIDDLERAKTSAPADTRTGAAAPVRAAGADPLDDQPPANARVGDVLDWAGTSPERLRAALAAEEAGKHRTTLIAELKRRLGK